MVSRTTPKAPAEGHPTTSRGTGRCALGHEWRVIWWTTSVTEGIMLATSRAVQPARCPSCRGECVHRSTEMRGEEEGRETDRPPFVETRKEAVAIFLNPGRLQQMYVLESVASSLWEGLRGWAP